MQVHGVRFVALVIESEPVSFARLDLNWVGLGKGLPVDGPVIHPAVPRKFLPENKRHHLDIPPSEAKQRVSLSSEDGVVPARAGWCGPPRRTFAVCVFHHHSQTARRMVRPTAPDLCGLRIPPPLPNRRSARGRPPRRESRRLVASW